VQSSHCNWARCTKDPNQICNATLHNGQIVNVAQIAFPTTYKLSAYSTLRAHDYLCHIHQLGLKDFAVRLSV